MNGFYDKTKVYLEVRAGDKINQNEFDLLDTAQLLDRAPVEIWSACGTNNQLAYSTHGLFRYFGKFPPPIATHLIRTYTQDGDIVLDLMSGSGTTGVEALLENRNCILNDVNPLSILLAKVKTTHIPEEVLTSALGRIEQAYSSDAAQEYAFVPTGLKNFQHWFLPETADSLRRIKFGIENEENADVRNFFNVCFAAIIRRVSRATIQQGRLFLDAETADKEALPYFVKKTKSNIKAVCELPVHNFKFATYTYDLRSPLPSKLHATADLVILHPPYFNSYKYSSINSLELSWLGFNYNDIRYNEVKEFFKVGKEDKASIYVEDMVNVVNNCTSVLKKGATLALMIGDTVIHGNYIPVTKMVLDKIDYDKLELSLISLRVPKYTEASWAASQRRQSHEVGVTLNDFILVLRRK